MVRVQILGGVLAGEPSPAYWAHRPTGKHQFRTLEIRVQLPVSPLNNTQSRGPTATTLGSHPGNDGSTPSGTTRLGRQSADHLGLEPGMLWVRVPPGPLAQLRPRGAARSARLPVTQEIVGSNPIGDARKHGTVRQPAERPSSNLGACGFDSLPCYSSNMRRLGIGEPKWL